jgi:hypothetical protein
MTDAQLQQLIDVLERIAESLENLEHLVRESN